MYSAVTGNSLSGPIPTGLADLPLIRSLEFSRNNFSCPLGGNSTTVYPISTSASEVIPNHYRLYKQTSRAQHIGT